jgi:hypothetical protein
MLFSHQSIAARLLLQMCDVLSGAIMPALVQHHADFPFFSRHCLKTAPHILALLGNAPHIPAFLAPLLLQVCDVLSGAIMPALVQHHANLFSFPRN